jgi:hypothetical protein
MPLRFRKLPAAAMLLLFGVGGCAGPAAVDRALPDRYTLVRDQLTIHSDFVLAPHHRLLDDLIARRADITGRLGLPTSDEPIQVYLFESPERFQQIVRARLPGAPSRRAFFVETDSQLTVYAHWGDHVAEDLRHEVTHGYLHSVVPNLPLWLDEGLAEYFEVPRGRDGDNRAHLERLLVRRSLGQWTPDLRRLEAIDPAGDLDQDGYAESWAWTHLLLDGGREYTAALRGYLADLRVHGTAEPLSARLASLTADPGRELVAHVLALAPAGPGTPGTGPVAAGGGKGSRGL